MLRLGDPAREAAEDVFFGLAAEVGGGLVEIE